MQELQSSLCTPGPDLSGLIAAAEKFYEAAKAPATIKAFDSDLASFRAFTNRNHLTYLPSTVEAVILYVSSLAAADPPETLSSLSFAHRRRGLESPPVPRNHFVLREVLTGIRRTLGTAQHGADTIVIDRIRRIVAACPDTLLGKRDRALPLLASAAGSRASEVSSILGADDLSLTAAGDLGIRLRLSKTDQDQAGRDFVVSRGQRTETCRVHAIQAWISAAHMGQTGGLLFRAVNRHGKVSPHALSRGSQGGDRSDWRLAPRLESRDDHDRGAGRCHRHQDRRTVRAPVSSDDTPVHPGGGGPALERVVASGIVI